MKISESESGWRFDDLFDKTISEIILFGSYFKKFSGMGRNDKVYGILSHFLRGLPNGVYYKDDEGEWQHSSDTEHKNQEINLSAFTTEQLREFKIKVQEELHKRGTLY